MAKDIINSNLSVHLTGTLLRIDLDRGTGDHASLLRIAGKRFAGTVLDIYLSADQLEEIHEATRAPAEVTV